MPPSACTIAQPALSAQIRSLETQLGTELFSRTTRKVDLTPAGELLLTDAREIVERADRAAAKVAASRRASPSSGTERPRLDGTRLRSLPHLYGVGDPLDWLVRR